MGGGEWLSVRHLRGRDHRTRRADLVPLGRDFQHHSRFAGSLLEGRREGGRPPQKVSSARRSATSSCRRCKEQFFFRRVSATRLPSRSSSESLFSSILR